METKDKIFTSFIILLLYGAAFVNPYGNKSIFGDYIYLTILVTPILFWFIIKNYFHQQEKSITTINYAIILLSTLMSIVAITYQFNIMQSSLYPIYPPTKISGIIVLSLPYIIKQYSLTKNTKQRRIIAFLLVLDIFGVICCESRTAFLAIIFTSLYLLIDRYKPFFYKNKKLSFIFIIFLLLLFVCIVSIRTDSSYGRLVVWRTSLDMIADKPLFGFGKGGFLANYMDYQAQTISNYEEKLQYLADNISHPFNEFILIAVDYGLVVLLLLVLLITKKIMMARTLPENNKTFTNCSLIIFITLSLFSYPFAYSSSWAYLLLFFLLSTEERYLKFSITSRIAMSLLLFTLLYYGISSLVLNSTWKRVISMEEEKEKTEIYRSLNSTRLSTNLYFQYNYGAYLNSIHHWDASQIVLNNCSKQLSDYNLELLIADNFYNLGNYSLSLLHYEKASKMIPNRFLPLFKQFELYNKIGDNKSSTSLAYNIINKKVKVNSLSIRYYKDKCKTYLESTKNQNLLE